MKTAILYHQVKQGIDCPDGIVSAWIAHKVYPDADIIGCVYQSEPPTFSRLTNIIIVDFSFPKEIVKRWLTDGNVITILDHHPTALDELSSLSDRILGKIDTRSTVSGARLTWQHFFVEPEPEFIKYIVDRDNFNFAFDETQVIHEAFSKMRSLCPDIQAKFALFDSLEHLTNKELLDWLVPIGEDLLKPKKEAIARAFLRWEEKEIGGYIVPCISLEEKEERLTSDICMAMYRDKAILKFGYPFVACINSDGKTVSLRSDKNGNNFDVSAIARRFGGGGHRNASGFKLK
jgi:uncharacterized protein